MGKLKTQEPRRWPLLSSFMNQLVNCSMLVVGGDLSLGWLCEVPQPSRAQLARSYLKAVIKPAVDAGQSGTLKAFWDLGEPLGNWVLQEYYTCVLRPFWWMYRGGAAPFPMLP